VNIANSAGNGASQEVRVTAAETDGENCMGFWPSTFIVYMTRKPSTLHECQAWVKRYSPPICTFMPDRLQDVNANTVNKMNFSSFSRVLLQNQMVAFAPWNASDRLPGAGIVLYPTPNSSNLLFGAVLLSTPIPDFVAASFATFIPPGQMAYPQQSYPQQTGSDSSYAMTYHTPLQTSSSHSPRSSQSPTSFHRSTPLWGTTGSLTSPSTAGMSSYFTTADPDDDRMVGRVSRTLGVYREG